MERYSFETPSLYLQALAELNEERGREVYFTLKEIIPRVRSSQKDRVFGSFTNFENVAKPVVSGSLYAYREGGLVEEVGVNRGQAWRITDKGKTSLRLDQSDKAPKRKK